MLRSATSRLFLLRHAHSSWAQPGQRDHQRPLDDRGRREAPRVGAAFQALSLTVEQVIASSATRVQETLALIRPFLGRIAGEETSDDLYALGVPAYLAAARHSGSASLMLVGHNPTMEDLAEALVGEGEAEALDRLRDGFPTSGLAILEFETPLAEIAPGSGRLAGFLAPKAL